MSTTPPACIDAAAAAASTPSLALRLGAIALIFVVSLFASSFPALAQRSPRLAPPLVVFFIGKHFGTGVILATAFVHLLQQGFESLAGPWRQWGGLIVLLALLVIFLIEYISTVYVEYISRAEVEASTAKAAADPEPPYRDDPDPELEEARDHARSATRSFRWHHRHESPYAHPHKAGPRLASMVSIFAADQADESEHHENGRPHGHENGHAHGHENGHAHGHGHENGAAHGGHAHAAPHPHAAVSRKTRLIGILVLQTGIMLHSLVIGFTLSVTSGPKFTSLLTAILFHQLFEGLSLGLRIAALPRPSTVLPVLFAAAAPAGALLALARRPPGAGALCLASAGMLVYAATVEMLAADFVLDPEMRAHGLGRQALALGSLLLGVAAMAVLGIWA